MEVDGADKADVNQALSKYELARTMRLNVLLLLAALLPLLCAELSDPEESSSISGPDTATRTPCEEDCEESANGRKTSTPGTEEEKCELYYFVPTAKRTNEAFFFWNNTKVQQLLAYRKIESFLEK